MNLRTSNRNISTAAMIDCGATTLFLDHKFISQHQLRSFPLRHPIVLYNIDGSENQAGRITHYVQLLLSVGDYQEWTNFLVTDLGGEPVILGLPWLCKVDPSIDWEKGTLRIVPSPSRKVTIEEIPDHEIHATQQPFLPADGPLLERIEEHAPASSPTCSKPTHSSLSMDTPPEQPPLCRINANRSLRRTWVRMGIIEHTSEEVWCAAGFTYSQQIAEKAHLSKPERTFEEMVPEPYREHATVFSESESHRLPDHKPWDHAIDLTPGAPATMCTKIYP